MGILDWIWDKATDIGHAITGIPTADEKRNQQKMIRDQINAYRQQTEITKQEINRKKDEEMAQKRRIEEKQIRGLRRNYRPQGFLGGGNTDQQDMNSKLGG